MAHSRTTSTNEARFRAVVEQGGKAATGICVPDEVVALLGRGKRPPVRVAIGDHSYRSTVASMGGRFMIPLSAENRGLAGVGAGDEVEVHLVLDDEVRNVAVPADFAAALAADEAAARFFDGLSYSQKRWFVLGIEGAKQPETRQRRITAAVERLRSGRGQR